MLHALNVVELRDQFDVYSDGLFTLPFNVPGTPLLQGRACARLHCRPDRRPSCAPRRPTRRAARRPGPRGRRNALQLLLEAEDENGDKVGISRLAFLGTCRALEGCQPVSLPWRGASPTHCERQYMIM